MITKNRVFRFQNYINLRKYQIVSKKLFQTNDATIYLFSYDSGESVSEQSNSEDIIIFVLEGEVSVSHGEVFTAQVGEVLGIPKNTMHRVYSKKESKVLQLSMKTEKGDINMNEFIKKINQKEVLDLAGVVEYEEGGISSLALVQRESLTLTLFAFDKGQKIASHSSNGDALVQVLDGETDIEVDGEMFNLKKGESIIMPAGVPHALFAKEKFKMFLTVVKPVK